MAPAAHPALASDSGGHGEKKPKVESDPGALKIKLGISENEDFTRLTFTPTAITTIEFVEPEQQKGVLIVNIGRNGIADLSALRASLPRYVYDVEISSALRDTLQLKIIFPESSRVRYFQISTRGIVDIFAPQKPEELTPAARKAARDKLQGELNAVQQEKIAAAASAETKQEAADKAAATPAAVPHIDLRPAADEKTIKAQEAAAVAASPVNTAIGDNVITFSSTESFNLAAFERLGYLWVVLDRPDMAIPPVVEGPQKSLLENPDRIPLDGGIAYRFRLPQGVYVQPQGGGFIWKLAISGKPAAMASAAIRKNYVREGESSLSLTLKNARNLLKVSDPIVGDDFAVVTVPRADNRLYQAASFVDVDVIPAYVGAVLIPKSDGLRIEAGDDEVSVRRVGGLNVGPAVATYKPPAGTASTAPARIEDTPQSMFSLARWVDPSKGDLDARERQMEIDITESGGDRKRSLLLNKAEFLIARNMAHEALGYLELAEGLDDKLADLPEYQAIKAVAQTLSWRYDDALKTLKSPVLQNLGEAKFWKALAEAGKAEYDKAYADLPKDLNFLKAYPPQLRTDIMLSLAEIALQNNDAVLLKSVVEQMKLDAAGMTKAQQAGLSYYRGRLAMVSGLPGDVKVHLQKAVDSGDLFYGTRAEYALINEQLRNKEITPKDALPRLERIRFAWRGDELELDINRTLGETYIAAGEEEKGMNILRSAAEMAPSRTARAPIVKTMAEAFKTLFLKQTGEDATLKPLEALAVYEEFKELLPAGDDGDVIIGTIADKLVSVDLLSRAVSLLDERMTQNLAPAKRPRWALKAAAISLMNRKPADALRFLAKVPAADFDAAGLGQRAGLIKARALADLKRTKEAMALLDTLDGTDPEIIRLKADTGWRGQQWSYAAAALNQLLGLETIADGTALTTDQSRLILNAAIATNLSGDAAALETLREKYDAVMRSSPLYKSFQVVTRPIRAAVLSDRDTIMSHVFEVDMFGKSLSDISNLSAVGN